MSSLAPVKVFISYKKDHELQSGRKLIEELLGQIKLLDGGEQVDVWWDKELRGGDPWDPEIHAHLADSEVMVAILSHGFFAEDGYIYQNEWPTIKIHAEKHTVIPVIRADLTISDLPKELKPLHFTLGDTPIESFNPEQREIAIAEVAEHVVDKCLKVQAARNSTRIAPFVQEYLTAINDAQATVSGSPEARLTRPVQNLIANLAPAIRGRALASFPEDLPEENFSVEGVRLDLAVQDQATHETIGHIELKAQNKGAIPTDSDGKADWSSHDKRQWEKLKDHPNLVYTNGLQFTLVRSGVEVDRVRLERGG